MSYNYNWGTPLPVLGDTNGDEAEQRRSPAAPNYNTSNSEMHSTGAWLRAEEAYQSVPYSDSQSMFNTNMPMADSRDPQQWSDLDWLQRFYRSGGGQGGTTPETFSWQPTAPLHHRDNSIVSGMLSGPPVVNRQLVHDFMADADRSARSPYSNIDPRALNTHPRVSNAGTCVPVQSFNQPYSFGQGPAVDHVGPTSFAPVYRPAPQSSMYPPARQVRNRIADGMSVTDRSFASTGSENHMPGPAMYHGGQARLGVGMQQPEANPNQTAMLVCPDPTCRKQFRDEDGLRKHSQIHSGEGPRYACDRAGCEYVFRWPKDLENHKETHDEYRVPNVFCEVPGCYSGFSRRYNYLRHLRANHPDSRTAAAILAASARPDRLPRLRQPTKPSARKSKKSATEASGSRVPSQVSGSPGLLLPEQHRGPALSYRGPFLTPEPNRMMNGMPTSTASNRSSLLTPSTTGSASMFGDAAFSPGPGSSYSAQGE